jgi:tRNA threonylcarbamoyladenosine biosynthesis protein TsaE
MEINIRELSELPDVAKKLLQFSEKERVFLFEGDMGVGKTTLIKSLCEQLGVADNTSSPTYSLVNEYDLPGGKVFHFDFFRIKNEHEAYDIGFEEYLTSEHYCFIEWPEKVQNLWPPDFIKVALHQTPDGTRILKASRVGR